MRKCQSSGSLPALVAVAAEACLVEDRMSRDASLDYSQQRTGDPLSSSRGFITASPHGGRMPTDAVCRERLLDNRPTLGRLLVSASSSALQATPGSPSSNGSSSCEDLTRHAGQAPNLPPVGWQFPSPAARRSAATQARLAAAAAAGAAAAMELGRAPDGAACCSSDDSSRSSMDRDDALRACPDERASMSLDGSASARSSLDQVRCTSLSADGAEHGSASARPAALRAHLPPRAAALPLQAPLSPCAASPTSLADARPFTHRDKAELSEDELGGSICLDADCCGDSGAYSIQPHHAPHPAVLAALSATPLGLLAPSLLGLPEPATPPSPAPAAAAQAAAAAVGALALPLGKRSLSRLVSAPATPTGETDDEAEALRLHSTGVLPLERSATTGSRRPRSRRASTVVLSEGQAAVELFFRLNHARQTVDFVKRQATRFSAIDKVEMGVWEALETLNELREYEAALLDEEGTLSPEMPLLEHAFQTAEACRAAYPDLDWLHLAGLMHGLGKLLAHKRVAGEPQWAVCGESFPVGCRFSQAICCPQFFSVNPDRRRRLYNTPTGMYRAGGGLAGVFMSWSAPEYLYMVLVVNKTRLPSEALFMLRYQKFRALTRPGGAYAELMSPADRQMLPMLAQFQELIAYKRQPVAGALTGAALREYYSRLIAKYIPQERLRW